MGADLYIRSLFDPGYEEWVQPFQDAIEKRDALPERGPKWHEAQRWVEECYERMYERGYFRDPYNDWSLLRHFELSWWSDVQALLDEQHQLLPENADALLVMLHEREAVFEEHIGCLDAGDRRYFKEQYRALQDFLRAATARGEPIECSI